MVLVDRRFVSLKPIERMYLHIFQLLLTLVLCSMIGSDSSETDYPGKVPSGEDAPSDDVCTDPDGLPN